MRTRILFFSLLMTASCSDGSNETHERGEVRNEACGAQHVPPDPCSGVPMAPPPPVVPGALVLGATSFTLDGGGLADIDRDYVATFPFDARALGVTLDLEQETMRPPVYVIDFDLGEAAEVSDARVSETNDGYRVEGRHEGEPLSADLPSSLVLSGTTRIEVDGTTGTVTGELGRVTYHQIEQLRQDQPEVDTLVLADVPGSIDDEANVQTGRLVRAGGLQTHIPADGFVASGGVDLFVAGATRSIEGTPMIGVHSWTDGTVDAGNLSCDDARHRLQLCYFSEMLGREAGAEFYFFTLAAAPADDIHYMTSAEIAEHGLATR